MFCLLSLSLGSSSTTTTMTKTENIFLGVIFLLQSKFKFFLFVFFFAIIRFPFYTTFSSLSAGAFQTFLSACMEKGQVLPLTADTQWFWTVSWVWWPPLILRSHYRRGLALAGWISPSVSVINHVWNLSTVASVFCVWSVNLFLFTVKFEHQAKGLGTEQISFTVGVYSTENDAQWHLLRACLSVQENWFLLCCCLRVCKLFSIQVISLRIKSFI